MPRGLAAVCAFVALALPAGAQTELLPDPRFERPQTGWQPFELGFAPVAQGRTGGAIRCVNPDDTAVRGAGAHLTLNQKTPAPVLVTGWSRADGVSGTPNVDYALYVDVDYTDGTHLWGSSAAFTTGTHDWQRRQVLVSVNKPIATLHVYALFRRHAGTAWFDDFSAVELRGSGVFDSQRLAPPRLAPGQRSGWFVRDVAAESGLVPLTPNKPALGLTLALRMENGLAQATLTQTGGKPRAVTLYYVERAGLTNTLWWNDIRQVLPATEGERSNVTGVALGAVGALSRYPYACVSGTRAGKPAARSLALPPELGPRIVRLGYHANADLLYAAFDFGFAPAQNQTRATAAVLAFDSDPAWGFRDTVAQYNRRFPSASVRRAKAEGIWVPFANPANVPGLVDFGIAYHEGDNSVASDDRLGILSFRYTEPMSWWMVMPPTLPRTYENAIALARQKAAGSDPEERRWAQALLSSGAQGPDGRFLGDFRKEPWADGIAWVLSPDPNLPRPTGQVRKAELVYDPVGAAARYPSPSSGLDGEYLDSLEMWSDTPNYRTEQLRATRLPLTFASDDRQPVVPLGFSVWEQTRQMSDDLHRRGKLLMANSTPIRFFAFAPLLDVMGIETNWRPGGQWIPDSDATMNLRRTLSGTRPYLLLQNTDLEQFGPFVERYFQRALFYGIYPSFFSIDAANDNYWDRPRWYERDRPLFRRYLPVVQQLSKAGWQPITHARSDQPSVWVERFGSEWLTILNDSHTPQKAILTIALAALHGKPLPQGATVTVTDALTGETLANLPARPSLRLTVPLTREQCRALKLTITAAR